MITLLGSTGMLGSMMSQILENAYIPKRFDALDPPSLTGRVVNCIGLIKPRCQEPVAAIKVNALFPHRLPVGSIHITTDCVFSGGRGSYDENSPHDATDVYGQTKSLGESSRNYNLRCSIIGPGNSLSLFDWFMGQTAVEGYSNHFWNGLTSLHLAKITNAIVKSNLEMPPVQHIVPADWVSKYDLLQLIAEVFSKQVKIQRVSDSQLVDRVLATVNPELNGKLWKLAGYNSPPTIKQMLQELYESMHDTRHPA